MKKTKVTPQQVMHVASLAHIPITDKESKNLAQAFEDTLEVVDTLQNLDTSNTPQTHQVTGLENTWRADVVDTTNMFTQQQALANAKNTHDGYIVVNRIIDNS